MSSLHVKATVHMSGESRVGQPSLGSCHEMASEAERRRSDEVLAVIELFRIVLRNHCEGWHGQQSVMYGGGALDGIAVRRWDNDGHATKGSGKLK